MTMSPGRCYERRGILGIPSAGPTKQAAPLSVILHLVLDRGRANVYNVIRMKWPRSCESRARRRLTSALSFEDLFAVVLFRENCTLLVEAHRPGPVIRT